MIDARDDLERRRPVWAALSRLYLDIDERDEIDACAQVLAASTYPTDELATILRREVHPVLRLNLLAPAGVWQGFDLAWLEGEILRRHARPRGWRPRGLILRATADALWIELAPRIDAHRRDAHARAALSTHPRP